MNTYCRAGDISRGVRPCSRAGFTLLEMLIVIGLLAAITGALMFDFASTKALQDLDLSVATVTQTIADVRSWGRTGREFVVSPTHATADTPFDNGHGVYFSAATGENAKIIVYGGEGTQPLTLCGGNDCKDANCYANERKIKEIPLTGRTIITAVDDDDDAASADNVMLHVRRGLSTLNLHHKASVCGEFDEWISITLTNGSYTRTIKITNAGGITIE